ncbi:MAG: hypothetical protein WCL18_04505 [bacterium]
MTLYFLVTSNKTQEVIKIKSRIFLINHRKIYAGHYSFLSEPSRAY